MTVLVKVLTGGQSATEKRFHAECNTIRLLIDDVASMLVKAGFQVERRPNYLDYFAEGSGGEPAGQIFFERLPAFFDRFDGGIEAIKKFQPVAKSSEDFTMAPI